MIVLHQASLAHYLPLKGKRSSPRIVRIREHLPSSTLVPLVTYPAAPSLISKQFATPKKKAPTGKAPDSPKKQDMDNSSRGALADI
jgi:hypothetical protein